MVVGAGLVGIAFYLLLRERRREVRKNVPFCLGDAPRSFSYNLPRGLCEYA